MNELAQRYAQALFELTKDEAALRSANRVLTLTPALLTALENPCVSHTEKEAVLDAALAESGPALRSFFKLLCAHGRLALLPDILDAFHALSIEQRNAMDAVMHSAFVPSEAEKASIAEALAAKYGKAHVELTVVPAPELLGGFTLTIGSDTYDKSVLGNLRELKSALI